MRRKALQRKMPHHYPCSSLSFAAVKQSYVKAEQDGFSKALTAPCLNVGTTVLLAHCKLNQSCMESMDYFTLG